MRSPSPYFVHNKDRWRIIGLLLPVIFMGLLACNLGSAANSSPNPSGAALRQTLISMDNTRLPDGTQPPALGPTAVTIEQQPGPPTPIPDPAFVTPPHVLLPGPVPFTFTYYAQSGDTVPGLAGRFSVIPTEITSQEPIPETGYIRPGQDLLINETLDEYFSSELLFPDSEVIYSPTTVDFDINAYVLSTNGFLSRYKEPLRGKNHSGAEIVQRVAVERSVNPRMLLAFLEHRSGWVLGEPRDPNNIEYPIGFYVTGYSGLYQELSLVANHLNIPYYEWRRGRFEALRYKDGQTVRPSPGLNAGTVAVMNLFAKFFEPEPWEKILYGENNFNRLYEQMFGNPWQRAAAIEPLLGPDLTQPILELPFQPGETWSLTGGPHRTLNLGSPLGALDFAPTTGEAPCAVSRSWVIASAPGLVTRAGEGIVSLDLDGDGYEQTGWVIFYLHIADQDRVLAGTRVASDQPLGHPSCEGGSATGTHVHIARKYNGEWMAADGPTPFVLSGWVAHSSARVYEGYLTKGNQVVTANPGGSQTSAISR